MKLSNLIASLLPLLIAACTVSGPSVQVKGPSVRVNPPVEVEVKPAPAEPGSFCPPGQAKKGRC